jgi:hypothetical protein
MDGREIASLSNGATAVRDIPAGNHEFSVEAWDPCGHRVPMNAFKIKVNAKPGMLYTLMVQPGEEVLAAAVLGAAGIAPVRLEEAASSPSNCSFEMHVVSETKVAG